MPTLPSFRTPISEFILRSDKKDDDYYPKIVASKTGEVGRYEILLLPFKMSFIKENYLARIFCSNQDSIVYAYHKYILQNDFY